MTDFISLLQYPFVQRALVAGIFAAGLLACLGIFVVLKKMSFFSEGLAHASLSGIAIGLLLSQEPLLWALIVSVLFAIAIYFLEKRTNLSPDSLIGILFTSSLALGVLLINLKSGYQPDLMSFLFGNILTISDAEVWIIFAVSLVTIAFLIIAFRKYLFISLNEELAKLSGVNTEFFRFVLYITIAVSVVLGIKMLGIVLVSALLIIPVSTAKLFAHSAKFLLILSIIISEWIMLMGIFLSLIFNLPTGSVIILTGTFTFIISLVFKGLFVKNKA